MQRMILVGLFLGCSLGSRAMGQANVPAAKEEKPLLKCELKWTGKLESTSAGKRTTFESPGAGEMKITNMSDSALDIGSNSNWGPRVHFDLKVKDATGKVMKTNALSDRFTQAGEYKPFILKPGKDFQWTMGLLTVVPDDHLPAGTYRVQAVFKYRNKLYESEWIEVKWPGKKK